MYTPKCKTRVHIVKLWTEISEGKTSKNEIVNKVKLATCTQQNVNHLYT